MRGPNKPLKTFFSRKWTWTLYVFQPWHTMNRKVFFTVACDFANCWLANPLLLCWPLPCCYGGWRARAASSTVWRIKANQASVLCWWYRNKAGSRPTHHHGTRQTTAISTTQSSLHATLQNGVIAQLALCVRRSLWQWEDLAADHCWQRLHLIVM